MDSACRRCIRKAEKSGVTIEEAHDLAFADEYYEQLVRRFCQAETGPDLQRGSRANVDQAPRCPPSRILLLRAETPTGSALPAEFSRVSIRSPSSGAMPAFGRARTCVPTN